MDTTDEDYEAPDPDDAALCVCGHTKLWHSLAVPCECEIKDCNGCPDGFAYADPEKR